MRVMNLQLLKPINKKEEVAAVMRHSKNDDQYLNYPMTSLL